MICQLYSEVAPTCELDAVVRQYLVGPRCLAHSPAALEGRTVPVPVALPISAPRPAPTYGTSRLDPLGRTVPGNNRTGFIPRRPDPTKDTPR